MARAMHPSHLYGWQHVCAAVYSKVFIPSEGEVAEVLERQGHDNVLCVMLSGDRLEDYSKAELDLRVAAGATFRHETAHVEVSCYRHIAKDGTARFVVRPRRRGATVSFTVDSENYHVKLTEGRVISSTSAWMLRRVEEGARRASRGSTTRRKR
ncbi:unnamed protein product [Symbiodinium necroappetens]|uniref:Uncharacterized protein n=1 Tax=Symbiodinium necroappetens TaxID=1628268 RepID=A0A812K3J1_9DINO|nr:unnamed protein product [Symbiodinium necroappetens]